MTDQGASGVAVPASARAGDPRAAADWLLRNVASALPEGQLAEQLASGRKLRVKLGVDPTAPDIHLGHVVVLRKLREFQELGHTVVLIIGDFTARVGDPSGRSRTRPRLNPEAIEANARTYQEQAFRVLDRDRTEVVRNSAWLDMPMSDLFALASRATVAQLLDRDDFRKRYEAGTPISLLELLYPLLQAYDSVAVRADVELGGTDQTFNLLFAREIQQTYGQSPQSIVTMPILPGIDGVQKMSKSLGNHIGVTDPPEEMFGKLMRIPDTVMDDYYRLLLDAPRDRSLSPVEAKRALARAVVAQFWGAEAAVAAEARFNRIHVERRAPDDVEEVAIAAPGERLAVAPLLADAFGISRSEARRLVAQGAVEVGGERLPRDAQDVPATLVDGAIVRLGKRRFKRVRLVDAASARPDATI